MTCLLRGILAAGLEALDATESNPSASTRIVIDWELDDCASIGGTITRCVRPSSEITVDGTRARYIIARLCSDVGSAASASISCPAPLEE